MHHVSRATWWYHHHKGMRLREERSGQVYGLCGLKAHLNIGLAAPERSALFQVGSGFVFLLSKQKVSIDKCGNLRRQSWLIQLVSPSQEYRGCDPTYIIIEKLTLSRTCTCIGTGTRRSSTWCSRGHGIWTTWMSHIDRLNDRVRIPVLCTNYVISFGKRQSHDTKTNACHHVLNFFQHTADLIGYEYV